MKSNFGLVFTALIIATGSASTHATKIEDVKPGTIIEDASIEIKGIAKPYPFPEGRWQVTYRSDSTREFGSRYVVPWTNLRAVRIDGSGAKQMLSAFLNLETGRFGYSGNECSQGTRKPELTICNDFGYSRSQFKSIAGSASVVGADDVYARLATRSFYEAGRPTEANAMLKVEFFATNYEDLIGRYTLLSPVPDEFSLVGDSMNKVAVAELTDFIAQVGTKFQNYYGGFMTRGEFFRMPSLPAITTQ